MNMTKKICISFLLSMLFVIALSVFSDNYVMATTVTQPDYHFVIGTPKAPGTEYVMKSKDVTLSVEADGWAKPATVQWISSEEGVVTLEPAPTLGSTFARMHRMGPGYSTISAIITSEGYTYTISCVVKVELLFDIPKTGLTTATSTEEKILVLNTISEEKPIYLKYVDYEPEDGVPVSGGAISTSAVMFTSDNEDVATVDEEGTVTAIGSGSAAITVTSATMSTQDKPMTITMRVVVRPSFTLTLESVTGGSIVYNSQPNKNTAAFVDKVPTGFTIESNATTADDLKWEVYDVSVTPHKKLSADSAKLNYLVSDMSGNVTFSNVKAGTYEIYALANNSYTTSTNAPYAYMKIIVPIMMEDISVVMQVGDTYNIFANSNIPSINTFNYQSSDGNIARVEQSTSIITARRKGTVTINCKLNTSLNLFTEVLDDVQITVTVIDGISLSATSAILNVKGTLNLVAKTTNSTIPIWTSSHPNIASVVDGLVTALKDGNAIITATQTINGVVKSASCEITVQKSVSNIVVDPEEVTIAIDAFKTLHATITPNDLSGIVLQWKSSDESIVSVVESSALTATIQGVSGGHAVISAINQDNVVVGYCHVSVQQPVTSIVLSETDITIDLKTKRLQLRATVYPENALNKVVRWTSTDESKASVDENGLVTIKAPGTVSIIATSDDNPAITRVCNITIQIPVTTLTLDEKVKTMYVGQASRLSYLILPTNASTNTVSWTSTNSSVATVDGTGMVVAKSVGTTVIILKTLDGGFTVYCTVTVKRVATGIKLDVSTLDLATGEYYEIKPTLTPKDSTDTLISWESSDTKIAVVDINGKVVAKQAGTAVIVARLESGAVAYCKVNVTQPVSGLLISFTDKTLYVNEKFKLKVSVSPSAATNLGVTWKSSNTDIVSINSEGEMIGLAGGVAIITCTTVDGGFTAACVVTVREGVSSISINYQTYYLGVDKTVMLVATVTTPNATNQDVYWSSSNPKIATVNQRGKVTGLKLGNTTITAIAEDGSEVEASCEITVVTPVSSITMNNPSISMLVGQTKKLKATVKPSNATIKSAKWTSSDDTVAIVDEDGVVIAIKAGSTTVTAQALDNSGKKALSYVTVYSRVASTGITLQDKKLVMLPGEEKIVQMVLIPESSTDAATWSTDNAAVARVDKKTGKITARAAGIAYITVMTDSGKTASVEVTVIGLNVTELITEVYTEYSSALEVEGATSRVTWRTSNPLVAEVYNDGTVSTRGSGIATITASVNGRKLTCKVVVNKMKLSRR